MAKKMARFFLKSLIFIFVFILCLGHIYFTIAFFPRPKVSNISNSMISNTKPILIAHGGGNGEFPDNTMEAMYNAYSVDKNVMLEVDVCITKDKEVILSHDIRLDKRTNKLGLISDWTYTELIREKVDFSYFNPNIETNGRADVENGMDMKYKNYLGQIVTPSDVPMFPTGLPDRDSVVFLATRLEDVLKNFPNNKINIEIKQNGETGLCALNKTIEIVNKYKAFDRTVFASFHTKICENLINLKHTKYKNLMYSPNEDVIKKYVVLNVLHLDIFFLDDISAFQIPMSASNINFATKEFIEKANQRNIAVHYWTIDNEKDMEKLIEVKADGIMTNLPHKLKNVLDRYK